jgi:hypothetical protein
VHPKSTEGNFEHAGALLTADGTNDDKIKLEGVATDQELSTI